MKVIGYRTLKTGIGATIAISIATAFGLKYATAAGIITILSIQSTKRTSLNIAIKRMGACFLALFLSTVLFRVFGFNNVVFGVFLMVFIYLASRFKLNEGIIVSSVLVTHFLVEKTVTTTLIVNELALMIIGIGVALILNLYMPSVENKIKEDQEYIEDCIREILCHMSIALRQFSVSVKEEQLFNNLESRLKVGRERAYRNLNNALFSDNSYYVKYMDMRVQQFYALNNMRRHFERFSISYKQSTIIADFTLKVSESLHEYNTAEGLLKSLKLLRESFVTMELPKTREEFENRAMLYQFLNDLEQFIYIKNTYAKTMTDI
ncbi:aromatic acid exporter family protein [Clostridium sp. CS001]|uniref:aromatic acid exporter family protein n=1 Tax=Clostridium sp. CS001 TaxID=2880648 RepID=UPI001CF3519F|nr:aromatic acid exporter family protein [Clostridium sp. CS001]MCB2291838.1 aromatic acid exporter family protein [Clostridium sp. CS001]